MISAGSEIQLAAGLVGVAVDRAARRQEEAGHLGQAAGIERVVGGNRPLFEVKPRALQPPARLRVSGQVTDEVVIANRRG